jgi:hypothetical protein
MLGIMVQDLHRVGIINMQQCSTSEQHADLMTKVLNRLTHQTNMNALGFMSLAQYHATDGGSLVGPRRHSTTWWDAILANPIAFSQRSMGATRLELSLASVPLSLLKEAEIIFTWSCSPNGSLQTGPAPLVYSCAVISGTGSGSGSGSGSANGSRGTGFGSSPGGIGCLIGLRGRLVEVGRPENAQQQKFARLRPASYAADH